MRTIYSYDRFDLFYIISPCAKMTSNINLMFTKKTVFVCFAIFKYQLQFRLSSVASVWKTFVSIVFYFFFPIHLILIKITACN